MDIRKVKKAKAQVDNEIANQYSHDMQLYKDLPFTTVDLQEFEELAIERLRVLRVLEASSLQAAGKSYDDLKTTILEELNKLGLKMYHRLITGPGCGQTELDYEARRRDHLSHFILRLAYCQSEEYRRWFVSREMELFKLRWGYLTARAREVFLEQNNLSYKPINEERGEKLREDTSGFVQFGRTEYYEVKWTDVLELIRHRKVYVQDGLAYITPSDLITVILSVYRSHLSHNLALMSHRIPILYEDERISMLVKNLHNAYVGKSYVNNENNHVSLESIDFLSTSAFPLCMRQLHKALRRDHHLKHSGRQQYSLFLKGIGLSLEDALKFWKMEFTKKMDADKFEKSYAYNFRHNYGKEGKRTNYTPYSCSKIIMSSVGPGDCHGCPFKHNDISVVKQMIQPDKLQTHVMQEVIAYASNGHCQLACAKYFEGIHGHALPSGVTHPNQYFEESMKIMSKGKTKNITKQEKRNKDTEFEFDDAVLSSISIPL